MTDEEKAQEEYNKLKEENKRFKLDTSRAKAMSVFSGAGLKEEEYSEILEDIVGEDPERTQKLAEKICKTITGQKTQVTEKIKQDIAGNTPKPQVGTTASQADIDKAALQKEFEAAANRGDYVKMAQLTRKLQTLK